MEFKKADKIESTFPDEVSQIEWLFHIVTNLSLPPSKTEYIS